MSKLKRRLLIVPVMLGVLVLAGIVYRLSGSAAVESWVGGQLLAIGGSYLEPQLRFGRLTYRRPRTILVDHLTLSSPDPTHPGASVVILAVAHARLELTEIPRPGQPLKFSEVILEAPELRAMALEPGSGRLVGFSKFMKGAVDTGGPVPAAGVPALKLSDFLLMRHVEIIHGLIRYDPRLPDTRPMELDDINAHLDLAPAGPAPGLYAIGTTITRVPIFALAVQGQFNLDTLRAELTPLSLRMNLRKEDAHYLPPELQNLVRNLDAAGEFHGAVSGTITLADFRQSTLHATAELTNAGLSAGRYRFWTDACAATVDIAGGTATIEKADARLLGGTVHLTGRIPLDATQPARLELLARDIQIEKILRATAPDALPLYAGKVMADVAFAAPLARWRTEAGGNGICTIRQGRIDNIPVLGSIIAGVSKVVSNTISGHANTLSDTAEASFTLAGDHVQLDHLAAQSGALALRGSGTIGFDEHLNLRLNAGPMERLQGILGDVGKIWASASDAMAGYRVTGTLADPQVNFEIGN